MRTIHGTHVAGLPGDATKNGVGASRTGAGRYQLQAPLLAWMFDPRRACHDKPTDWWYASDRDDDGNGAQTVGQAKRAAELTKRAQELCRGCRFSLECADYGLRNESFGMWGGVKLNGLTGAQKADRLAGVDRERRRRSA